MNAELYDVAYDLGFLIGGACGIAAATLFELPVAIFIILLGLLGSVVASVTR